MKSCVICGSETTHVETVPSLCHPGREMCADIMACHTRVVEDFVRLAYRGFDSEFEEVL